MTYNILTDSIRQDIEYSQLLVGVRQQLGARNPQPLLVAGLCDGATTALQVSLINDSRTLGSKITLIICPDEKECRRTQETLSAFGIRTAFWQLRDLTFYNVTVSRDFEHERLKVLFGILLGKFDAVVTTPDAALSFTLPEKVLGEHTMTFDFDHPVSLETLSLRLIDAGYSRCELVEGMGQFAIRGGIIDIFPPFASYRDVDGREFGGSYPVRIELFGDDVDRMVTFAPDTQRSRTTLEAVTIPPAKEIITDRAALEALDSVLSARLRSLSKGSDADAAAEAAIEAAAVKAALSGSSETPSVNFIDKYVTLVYPERVCLLDYIKSLTPVTLVMNTNAVNERLKGAEWHMHKTVEDLLESSSVAPKYAEYSRPSGDLEVFLTSTVALHVDSLSYGMSGKRLGGMYGFRTRQLVSYANNFELLCEDLRTYVDSGYRTVVIAENETAATNLCQMLTEAGYSATREAETGEFSAENLPRKLVLVKYREALSPFELFVPKFAIFSTVPDSRRASSAAAVSLKRRAKKKKGSEAILSYAELEVGDYVVHERYGIGRYTGIENLTVDGVSRDYFGVQYAGSDRLFLPVDKLDQVSKYIGAHADDGLVKLDRMSGESWGKSKARAKAAVKDIAKELIKLYAQRQRQPGFAFDDDNDFQLDFEAAFEYTETDAQLDAIKDIKEDMCRPVPMDRLLCGDVGYGKTEVALRAAFKAVMSGKQVAILVPTTILALQHFQTVQSRMRSFAINVDMVSRFRTSKQIAQSLRRLRRGETDIIIGTHRLLSKDVEFADLGLLVVDEEQRFGVSQKEKLKSLATGVDVLTLTATPIPRTLNMALGGIRDISVLDEAPQDRLPVQTYVLEDDDVIINEAIRRELRRGGQVFYLHNVVEDIIEKAAAVSHEHPDASVVYAHGKMSREELEDIWASMLSGKIDILVCTTIIETGVDVPNANTLIVDNAHRLGLSQLHQIRGRIGRSSRRAYAYFTYPKGRAITEIAAKRLEAIREYTEFGSGFRIAMRDLEIRGAGDLLGASQHGHLDAIGYDLYVKLLNEAILEEKGVVPKKKVECTVSLQFSAYLPEDYVKYPNQRMAMYKKIAMIETAEDVDDVADELQDRYGELPPSAENLLSIALIRANASRCGVSQITQNGAEIRIYPEDLDFGVWAELCSFVDGTMRVRGSERTYISYLPRKKDASLASVNRIFEKYLEIVSQNETENGV